MGRSCFSDLKTASSTDGSSLAKSSRTPSLPLLIRRCALVAVSWRLRK